jgi:hypothetical protein
MGDGQMQGIASPQAGGALPLHPNACQQKVFGPRLQQGQSLGPERFQFALEAGDLCGPQFAAALAHGCG